MAPSLWPESSCHWFKLQSWHKSALGSPTRCPTDREHLLCQPGLEPLSSPFPPCPCSWGQVRAPLPWPLTAPGPPLPAGVSPSDVAAPSVGLPAPLTLGPRSRLLLPRPPSACTVHTVQSRAGPRVRLLCGLPDSLNIPDPQDWLQSAL